MDQATTIGLIIFFIVGAAVLYATIYFGPNMKGDSGGDNGDADA